MEAVVGAEISGVGFMHSSLKACIFFNNGRLGSVEVAFASKVVNSSASARSGRAFE